MFTYLTRTLTPIKEPMLDIQTIFLLLKKENIPSAPLTIVLKLLLKFVKQNLSLKNMSIFQRAKVWPCTFKLNILSKYLNGK